MMIRVIKELLENKQYQTIRLNITNIFLYYIKQNEETSIIVLFDCQNGFSFSKEQYTHILNQIRNNFWNKGIYEPNILSLIFTMDTNHTKHLIDETEIQWFVDTVYHRLVVYENQGAFLLQLRKEIESILDSYVNKNQNETKENSFDEYNYGDYENRETYRVKPINRFRGNFSLINSIIIIINIFMYILVEMTGSSLDSDHMIDYGAMFWPFIEQGQYYRLLTYMFLHFGLAHLVNNMIVLGFLGDNLERAVGKLKYAIIYLGAGFLAGLVSMGYNMMEGTVVISAGASGAIFGIVGAMLYVVIINKGRLEDLSTIQLLFFVIFSLYGGFTSQGTDNMAHVGGFIAGIIISVLLYRKPK